MFVYFETAIMNIDDTQSNLNSSQCIQTSFKRHIG